MMFTGIVSFFYKDLCHQTIFKDAITIKILQLVALMKAPADTLASCEHQHCVTVYSVEETFMPCWMCLVLQVRLWTLSVGHTVGFAVLFTKTWRVYSLCSIKQAVTHNHQRLISLSAFY